MGGREVRVLLSTYDSRGGVEPLVALGARLRALGAEVLVCAPPDCAEGTTTTATRAGAPQVVVPQWADQPYWARRVARLGIGAAHDGPAPTTESLSAALRTALASETRERAAAVAGAIRTDGATVAAKLLLDAVSGERRPLSTCSDRSR
jgi:UDP:flavonoid glycosyltransferase YjiC (YdhE family)